MRELDTSIIERLRRKANHHFDRGRPSEMYVLLQDAIRVIEQQQSEIRRLIKRGV